MGSTNELNLQKLIDVKSEELRIQDNANSKVLDIRKRLKVESLANEDRTLIIELRRQLVVLQAKNARERRLRLVQKHSVPEPEREVGRVITDDKEASDLGSAILAARALTKLDGAIAAVYSLQGERDELVSECAREYGVDVSKILEDEEYVRLGHELLTRIRNCETSIKVLREANACKENAALMFDLLRSCADDVELMSMNYKTRHGFIMGLIRRKCKSLANKDVSDRDLSSRAITSHADPMNANTRVAGNTVYSATSVVLTGLTCAMDTLVHSGLIIAGVIEAGSPTSTPPKAEVVAPTINITMTQNIYNTLYNSLYNTILTGGDSQISSGDAAMIASAARQGSMDADAFMKYAGELNDSEKEKADALQKVTNDFASLNIKEEDAEIKQEIKDEDEEDEKQRVMADSANAVANEDAKNPRYNFRPRNIKTPPQ